MKKKKKVKPLGSAVLIHSKEAEYAKKVDEINQREDIHPFSPGKPMTYLWLMLFPPVGLYRLLRLPLGFSRSEKTVWTMVTLIYLVSLLSSLW